MNIMLRKRLSVVAMAAVAILAVSCGDDPPAADAVGDPEVTATASPDPTTEPQPTPTSEPDVAASQEPTATSEVDEPAGANDPGAEPEPWRNESEGPGEFRADTFSVPFTFVVGDDWRPAFVGAPDNTNIRLPDVAILFVLETNAPTVDLVLNRLTESPSVELSAEAAVQVGGRDGIRYELGGDYTVVPFTTTAGEFTLGAADEEAARVTVVDVDGSVLLVLEIADPSDPTVGWAATSTVVDSIAWD